MKKRRIEFFSLCDLRRWRSIFQNGCQGHGCWESGVSYWWTYRKG
jgi:hypothetical protein